MTGEEYTTSIERFTYAEFDLPSPKCGLDKTGVCALQALALGRAMPTHNCRLKQRASRHIQPVMQKHLLLLV
jgi:hypothetical protein